MMFNIEKIRALKMFQSRELTDEQWDTKQKNSTLTPEMYKQYTEAKHNNELSNVIRTLLYTKTEPPTDEETKEGKTRTIKFESAYGDIAHNLMANFTMLQPDLMVCATCFGFMNTNSTKTGNSKPTKELIDKYLNKSPSGPPSRRSGY